MKAIAPHSMKAVTPHSESSQGLMPTATGPIQAFLGPSDDSCRMTAVR